MGARRRGDERAALAVDDREHPSVLGGAHLQRDLHVPFIGEANVAHDAIEVLALVCEPVGIADVECVARGARDRDRRHGQDVLTGSGCPTDPPTDAAVTRTPQRADHPSTAVTREPTISEGLGYASPARPSSIRAGD